MQTINIQFSDSEVSRLRSGVEPTSIDEIQKKIQQFSKLFIWLPPAEQEAVLKAFRKQILLMQAEQLDGSVIPNTISMEEIVEEVLLVRAARYANQ